MNASQFQEKVKEAIDELLAANAAAEPVRKKLGTPEIIDQNDVLLLKAQRDALDYLISLFQKHPLAAPTV